MSEDGDRRHLVPRLQAGDRDQSAAVEDAEPWKPVGTAFIDLVQGGLLVQLCEGVQIVGRECSDPGLDVAVG